jgi:hypothetical protein
MKPSSRYLPMALSCMTGLLLLAPVVLARSQNRPPSTNAKTAPKPISRQEIITSHSMPAKSVVRPQTAAPAPPKPPAGKISLRVEPSEIPLYGSRAEGRIVATAAHPDGVTEDVSAQASLQSDNPKIARIGSDRVLRPVADGETTLTVAYQGQTAKVKVRVKDAGKQIPMNFAREIVPALTINGCNQGMCHGSQYGKGGFKLSLLGDDPAFDYNQIIKQARGRRVQMTEPARSLLLLKPSLGVPHVGGLRLKTDSLDYKNLLAWIQDGSPAPGPDDAQVTRIEVLPNQRILSPGKSQTLVVRAHYSDGKIYDVTRWARFTTLNDSIASVSPKGLVKALRKGETSIMVRYSGQATVARMAVPYAQIARYPKLPENNFVDTHIVRKWKNLGLLPSELSDDASFMRRVYLDVIGTPPTPEEVKAFLADSSPDKRAKLIDRALDRPEYADYWSLKWGDLLRSNRATLGSKGMWSLTNWIRAQLRENRPADQFVYDLITAQGSTFTNGPANYYRVASNPPDLAETTSQVFLGVRLQCAKCHNHPFEKWTMSDYYRFAAFFARVGQKGSQEFGVFGGENVVRLNNGGEVYHPKNGAQMKPTPLGGYPERMKQRGAQTAQLTDPEPDAGGDRRALLADWITKENTLFARNIVNRYWGYLMGRGLVEPIDDQRITNPPTNPELLDALAKDFMANGYDIKRLIRTICNSRVYQLSSQPTSANKADTVFYTHHPIKRLPAEVLFDLVNIATGTQEKFDGLPLGYRAIQLPDPQINSYFLDTFGRAPRVIACECERPAEPNMTQALHLMMGEMVNRKVQSDNAVVAKMIQEKKPDKEIIERLYLLALARTPRSEEMESAQRIVKDFQERPARLPAQPNGVIPQVAVQKKPELKDRDRRAALEDILWALLNSKEFVFNR